MIRRRIGTADIPRRLVHCRSASLFVISLKGRDSMSRSVRLENESTPESSDSSVSDCKMFLSETFPRMEANVRMKWKYFALLEILNVSLKYRMFQIYQY
ncbi:hypothetical protein TNIN_129141 [Trichonephila inaurata madagascariensis]|uniref:Uncharacterized protein n=1 Tax=Trichonephila inaurata madagascariensis TaxID=2747483 RepID=A0A8X7CT82_9ARAC|nr:hypothetical protein TNIN_129141 [Trichonephila inaurata madagascariensis]